MRVPALLAALASSFALTACCGLLPASSPRPVAAAPAPAPQPAPAPALAPVIAKGQKVTIELEVKFDTNQAVVKPEYDAQLAKVADFLKAHPETKAEIEGHTDDRGDAAANKDLSSRRAAAVRQALIDRFGADGARLSAAGYGEERPRAGNDSAEGRASNRRVVASFTAD